MCGDSGGHPLITCEMLSPPCVSTRTSPREQGAGVAGSGGVLKVTAVEMQVRRSGRTMACAGKPFDGMPLKMHKCTWCLSIMPLSMLVAMGNSYYTGLLDVW